MLNNMIGQETKVVEQLAKSYLVTTKQGQYGNFIITRNENMVSLIAQTSLGLYAANWNTSEQKSNVVMKLQKLSFIEVMKMFNKETIVFDKQETRKYLLETLENNCRYHYREAEFVNKLKTEIYDICEEVNNYVDYEKALTKSILFPIIYESEWSAIEYKTKQDPNSMVFWNELWIPFVNHLG